MTEAPAPASEIEPEKRPQHTKTAHSALRTSSPRKPARRVSYATSAEPSSKAASSFTPALFVTSSPWSRKLILTLDGGGIRGYSSLIILRTLMMEIADIERNHVKPALSSADTDRIPREAIPDRVYREGHYLPCHYFDYIAGTSFGGLIAIMIGMLGMSVQECIDEFNEQQESIPLTNLTPVNIDFTLLRRRTTWPPKRSSSFYETFARFHAAATARANAHAAAAEVAPSTPSSTSTVEYEFKKDSFQCQTLAWCTEIETRKPYAFCSYEDYESANRAISIPEVAMAITTPSSASFKPFKLGSAHFVDGSKQIRDPTLEVLREISGLLESEDPAIGLVLSLGTDEHHSWIYEILRKATQSPSPREAAAAEVDAKVGKEKGRSYQDYHRFEVPDIRLGFRRRFFLREIEDFTTKWLAEGTNMADIRRYAEALVETRRARAATPSWETFALGARYLCFHEGCPQKDVVFDSRGKFYKHLDRKHGLSEGGGKMDKKDKKTFIEEELDKGRRIGYGSG